MFTKGKGDADGKTTESFTERGHVLTSCNGAAQMRNNDSRCGG